MTFPRHRTQASREAPATPKAATGIVELAQHQRHASSCDNRPVGVEAGRWPAEVRPFTTNRRHVLAKVI